MEENFENRVKRLYKDAYQDLLSIGIYPSNKIRKVSINKRYRKKLGSCKWMSSIGGGYYEIEIAQILESCTDKEISRVLIHELLHSCPGSMNHGKIWKENARRVEKYLGYNIPVKLPENEIGLPVQERKNKYEIECVKCGQKYYRQKLSNLVKYPENYRCGKCGGTLRVKKLPD